MPSSLKMLIVRLRDWYLVRFRWRHFSIGRNFHAGRGVMMWAKHGIKIGDNCHIGRHSQIECDAQIGHNVLMAGWVAFVGRYDHNYRKVGTPTRLAEAIMDPDYQWLGLESKAVVGDDVWIGYGAIILSGVRIGEGSVVAAGSVVVENVPSYSIVGGNPARVISKRFPDREDEEVHRRAMAAWRSSLEGEVGKEINSSEVAS